MEWNRVGDARIILDYFTVVLDIILRYCSTYPCEWYFVISLVNF